MMLQQSVVVKDSFRHQPVKKIRISEADVLQIHCKDDGLPVCEVIMPAAGISSA